MDLVKRGLPSFILAAVVFTLYRGVVHYPFQFDSLVGIEQNPYIRDMWDIGQIWWHNPSRFIVYFSFAFNHHLGGYDTFGYHILNIIVHAVTTVVYYYFLRLLFRTADRGDNITVDTPLTTACLFTAALVFAVHPLQTQAVTYIWQRGTSIGALFYIGSLAAYLKSALDEQDGRPAPRWKGWLVASVGLAFLSMISKQFSVTIPVAVGLLEFLVISGSVEGLKKRLPRMAPFVPMLLIVPIFTTLVGKGEVGDLGERAANLLPTHQYLMTELNVIVFVYFKLLFYPVNQNLDYDFPPAVSLGDCAVAFMILAALFAAGVLLHRKNRIASFSIIFAFLAASVESSFFVLEDPVFEHRMYLPLTGLLAAMVALERQALANIIASSRARIIIAMALMIAVSVPLYAVAKERNLVWSDPVLLWADVVAKSPNKARGYNNLASSLLQKNGMENVDKAIELLKTGMKVDPNYHLTYYNLAVGYETRKEYAAAAENYIEAIRRAPNPFAASYRLGGLFFSLGNYDKAIKYFIMAANANPKDVETRMDLAVALGRSGKIDQAIIVFGDVLKIDPSSGQAHFNLANAYQHKGDQARAHEHLKKAEALGYK